ncbi:MAG TPA: bifunctional [glutamate--ammonia ligase]-adenylyl-L-tyrosine phosphorylase/[glutamate--ammonia-ligase] adenylyltransferase [Paenalcaligenes sp.]|nr:bifunctional [glutamate--ammonia ligase]-adenylyl-L-tyrosine phosphorylase/[glutamate--ammonia-ligase] adenylyltransferase [Paenalcaligenes sp.]
MPHNQPELTHAFEWSRALKRKINRDPDFEPWLMLHYLQPVTAARLEQWWAALLDEQCSDPDSFKDALRRVRDQVFFVQYLREVTLRAHPQETGHVMSLLAEQCVRKTYLFWWDLLADIHGAPTDTDTGTPLDLLIVAMGKWGGRELNVSSDIDFIVLYQQDGYTQGKRPLSFHEFYTRLTQRLLSTLSQHTVEGIVFRTDLRLRPDGDAGPLVWSLQGLHQYFIKQGRDWERYAWVKARPIQLRDHLYTRKAHQTLESIRQPFVYRKYLDFDALQPLRTLREQIRDDWHQTVRSRRKLDDSLNIKIGDGSIREIEFIVQLNQLIHGGHSPSLQKTNLHAALKAQVQAELIAPQLAHTLGNHYNFLRQIEHLLQFRDDNQTHLLPTEPHDIAALAALLGMNEAQFEAKLSQCRAEVSQAFKNSFRIVGMPELQHSQTMDSEQPPSPGPFQSQSDHAQLHTHWTQLQEQFFQSQRGQRLNEHTRQRILELARAFKVAVLRTENPIETAPRIWRLIDQIALRSAYLSLFSVYPETVTRCCKILATSPWAAQYLTQYPVVLNRLTQWHRLMSPVDFSALSIQLSNDLYACRLPDGSFDVEKQMNIMRDVQHQVIFQLLAQDLEGLFSVESLADQLSYLADYMLEHALEWTWTQVQSTYAKAIDKRNFAIISYGKLGGKELGYASDLDLVFLYDGNSTEEIESYVRLARRMINWLSALTSSGRLYEVDMRLRPDGNAGLIAVNIDTFEDYQRTKAWTWEHQAISRARFTAGTPAIGARFERLRRVILQKKRNSTLLKDHILDIRDRIAKGHPNPTDLFDLKHDRGGMVDVEFITQFLVLNYAYKVPKLVENLGNIALLSIASQYNLIPQALAMPVINSYRFYRRRQHSLRLQGHPVARIESMQAQPHRQAVLDLWRYIFEN